jgi:hypothetical protein
MPERKGDDTTRPPDDRPRATAPLGPRDKERLRELTRYALPNGPLPPAARQSLLHRLQHFSNWREVFGGIWTEWQLDMTVDQAMGIVGFDLDFLASVGRAALTQKKVGLKPAAVDRKELRDPLYEEAAQGGRPEPDAGLKDSFVRGSQVPTGDDSAAGERPQ